MSQDTSTSPLAIGVLIKHYYSRYGGRYGSWCYSRYGSWYYSRYGSDYSIPQYGVSLNAVKTDTV